VEGALLAPGPRPVHHRPRRGDHASTPGTQYLYSNPGNAMLGYCVTASLHGAPEPDLHGLLRNRLLRPVGVPDAEWAIGYGTPTVIDGLKLYATWGGASFTARAAATVGRLLVQGGRWDGQAVLDAERVRQLFTEIGNPRPGRAAGASQPANGLAIWLNVERAWPELPSDAVAGAGAGHQLLLVVPSLDLVVVRFGARLAQGGEFWTPLHRHVFAPLAAALI
jgi:CubicO group peptidase (beta-lactamase class C family)